MTLIAFQDGKPILRDGKVGTGQECCCGGACCSIVRWIRNHGACNNLPTDVQFLPVEDDCYSYYTWEDWDCQNPLVGRDCGEGDQCNIYARVKVTCTGGLTEDDCTVGPIEYLQADDTWGDDPAGQCDCTDSLGTLSAKACPEVCGCYWSGTTPEVEATVTVEWDGTTWTIPILFEKGFGEGTNEDGDYASVQQACTPQADDNFEYLVIYAQVSRVVSNPYGSFTQTLEFTTQRIQLPEGPLGKIDDYSCKEAAALSGDYEGIDTLYGAVLTATFP